MTINNIAFRANYPVKNNNTAKNLSFGFKTENSPSDQFVTNQSKFATDYSTNPGQKELQLQRQIAQEALKTVEIFDRLGENGKNLLAQIAFDPKNADKLEIPTENLTKAQQEKLKKMLSNVSKLPEAEQKILQKNILNPETNKYNCAVLGILATIASIVKPENPFYNKYGAPMLATAAVLYLIMDSLPNTKTGQKLASVTWGAGML